MSSDFIKKRLELRDAISRASQGEQTLQLSAKLDSSLKKNTSFIKKIKGTNGETAPAILAEICMLSLEKYLSEITVSLADGLLKLSKSDDIAAGVLVICALFQRFGDLFSAPLLSHLVNAAVEKHPSDASLKQKTALKFVMEMHLVGICSVFSDCAMETLGEPAAKYSKQGSAVIVVTLLKDVMSYRTEYGYALPVATTFLRRFSFLLSDDSDLIHESLQTVLRQLFTVYTTRILELLQTLHTKLLKSELNNKKASIRTGKIMAEQQEIVDEMGERKTLFETHATILCDILGMQMPELKAEEEPEKETVVDESKKTWWHDAKEREFYQDVPQYSDIIQNFDRKKLPESEYGTLSEGQKVNLFITQLEGLLEPKDLELITMIMHTYIPYNKATKHRIIRFFTEIKKIDNVNLYARFLRINAEYFPEVISELIETLDRGFRSQIRFDTLNFRNLAFFIELVKFKLIPSHVAFHKIRRMTLNIPGTSNVDILSVFYERCGEFLLFEPEYSATTREMLELLQMQAKSEKLTINEKLSLSNMFLIVDSFTASAQKPAPKKELTALQDYIHQTIKKLVTVTSYQPALELLSGIDFSKSEEAQNTIIDLYLKPEDLGGDRLKSLAGLLLCIGKTTRRIPITIVDSLTEKVIRGLELNDYRRNVSRVAQVKMIAALFNAKVLNFKSIIDLLFKIVCFGYPSNLPTNAGLDIDPPDNYFRIHLACALLKSINFLNVKSLGLLTSGVKTAEGFLVFLQYYTFCKVAPLPKDIEFSLSGVLMSFNAASKEKLSMAPDLASAMQQLQKYTLEHREIEGHVQNSADVSVDDDVESIASNASVDLSESEDSESDSDDEPANIVAEEENDEITEVSSDSEDDSEFEEEDDEEEEQQPFQSRMSDKEAQKMDDEINYLLSASMHQTRVSAPLRMPAPSTLVAPVQGKEPAKTFKFLTKSNNLRDLSLPTDNQFTERIASEQAAQKANRQKIMRLVDNMYES